MKHKIYTHPRYFQHEMEENHPESPKRLKSLETLFSQSPYKELIETVECPLDETLLRYGHTQNYLSMLEEFSPDPDDNELVRLDDDTSMNGYSLNAAKLGVASACQAIDTLLNTDTQHIFQASRPPGHHAEPHHSMGFCLLNTVYLAARHALNTGCKKVAILDFDVHHGNGTEVMMRANPSDNALFISTHEADLWPYTGQMDENGLGNSYNYILPKASGSQEMRALYTDTIFPQIDDFNPELVILSAGFDAYKADPLASLQWEVDDYGWLGESLAPYKTFSNLEGGYQVDDLKSCVDAYLKSLFQL